MTILPSDLKPLRGDHKLAPISKTSGERQFRAGFGLLGERDNSRDLHLERRVLLAMGWPESLVEELATEAFSAGVGLVQAAIAAGLVGAPEFYDEIAQTFAFAEREARPYRILFPNIPADAWHFLEDPIALPLDQPGIAALNAQTLTLSAIASLSKGLGTQKHRLTLLTRQAVINALTQSYGRVFVNRAVNALKRNRPDWSAKTGLAAWQACALATLLGVFIGAFAIMPRETLTLTGLILSVFFLLAIGLRFFAALNLARPPRADRHLAPPALSDADLPNYTIFVPLFREASILPYLARALSELDYPPAKLDIKIVLESVDAETIETALRLALPGNVDFIIVPDCQPRTKPKALNYALQFATGELAVIYDAEDRPEADQLRKAANVFNNSTPQLVCLQARLDYFNAHENWLSRQFTIEYASLFRGILPLLSRYKLPLPLGGTSNHFRVAVLRQLGAWDPFNVTEDADLGMRLHRAGYRVETLDSTTFEEACCQTGPWIKQRTRWLKGWMQTFGVHMRSPSRTVRETGLIGFAAFHAYFAGIIVSALAHPIFYLVMAYDAWTGTLLHAGTAWERAMLILALINFCGGYAVCIGLGFLSLKGTGHRGMALHLLFAPVYWLLVSAAAYRAVWQLIRAPFYWEKTEHGVSATLGKTA